MELIREFADLSKSRMMRRNDFDNDKFVYHVDDHEFFLIKKEAGDLATGEQIIPIEKCEKIYAAGIESYDPDRARPINFFGVMEELFLDFNVDGMRIKFVKNVFS